MNLNLQDIIFGIGTLIILYLVLTNYKGANALLTTGGSVSNTLIRTLQGR